MTRPLPGAQNAPSHLDALTSLRFVAAFAVLVLHYRDMLGPLPAWVMRGVVGGQYGVTFFFILSGFILTYRYKAWFGPGVSGASFWRFLRFRAARIYPVYLLGLLLDTPAHLIERLQAGQLAEVGQTYWASWLLNLVGLQAWIPAVPFAMFWNTPAWSVSAEFFFYATFPFVCAWLSARLRTTTSLATLFLAVLLGGLALYVGTIYVLNFAIRVSGETQYIFVSYNPLLRYSEFMAGCIAGQFFLLRRSLPARPAADAARARRWRDGLLAIAMLAVGVRVWSPEYTGPSQWLWLMDVAVKYAIFIVPFTAIILAVASGPTFLSPLLERSWMVLLGEASYSLYIIHWSVFTFLHMGYLGRYSTPAVHAVFLLATVGASLLCYRYVEVPWRDRLRGSREPVVVAGRLPPDGPPASMTRSSVGS
jgi:peptidoglycan/LPS O-acetylase OafA/YrhL